MPKTEQEQQMLDQDAVRLAKSIRYNESRDKEDAKGASGEFGLYQWMPDTWRETTKKYNLDPGDISRENQNKAAYMQIKELKDQGVPPDKIAAFWNMGGKALTKGYEGNVGVNKHGVKYDTPAYVRAVQATYEQLRGGEMQPSASQPGPSTVGHEQYGTPDPQPAQMGNGEILQAPKKPVSGFPGLGLGIAKSVGDTLADMSRLGDAVTNQTVGRLVSAASGDGFKPLPKELVEGQNIASDPGLVQALKPQGAAQKTGFYTGKVAEVLTPGGLLTKGITKSRALARGFADALDVVAPKETAKTIMNAIKQGRGTVGGFTRQVGMEPDHATELAARAVQGLVRKNATAAENANAVLKGIGETANELVTRLKSMEITPIVTPQELTTLFQKATARIGEDPTMVGNAGETAARIFTKFKSFLPEGKDITASELLEARKKLDAWMKSIKGGKVFDPSTENAVTIGLRAVRQEANDLIAAKAPDVNVKELLNKQSAMYDALENIAAKGVKEMGTTGPGRFLQRHPNIKKGLIGLLPGGVIGGAIGAKVFGDN